MKRIFSILFMILIIGAMSACQPTPIASTQSSSSIQEIKEDAGTTRCEQHFELDDNIQLVISASVIEPNGEFHKGNIEWKEIDSSFVEKVCQALSNNSIYYKAIETRSELTSSIETYRSQLDLVRDKLSPDDIRMIEDVISEMQDALSTSLETEPAITLNEVMVENEAKIQTGVNNKAVLVISDSGRKKFIRITNYRWKDIMLEQAPSEYISDEDAAQKAKKILQNMGLIDEFSLAAIKHASSEYTLVANWANQMGIADYPPDKRTELIFTRNVGGQHQVFSQQVEDGTSNREYDETVFWELIKMYFDNDGLVEFVWQQPCSVTIDSKGIQPISIEAAIDAMRQFLSVSQNKYSYSTYGIDSKNVTINIDRIELGMTCILGPDKTYLTIPVWEFYGNISYINTSGDIKYVSLSGLNAGEILDEPELYNSICTINAITGKRIDRTQGY